MNERIKELYLQAVEYSNGQMTFGNAREFFAEKFAELIVQETLNVALYGDEHAQARDNVKTLFGVEND